MNGHNLHATCTVDVTVRFLTAWVNTAQQPKNIRTDSVHIYIHRGGPVCMCVASILETISVNEHNALCLLTC